MNNLIYNLIGTYSPLCLDDGQPILGICGVDFNWLLRAVLLTLTVAFVYRVIVAIFRGFGD